MEGEAVGEVGGLARAVTGGEGMTVRIVATYQDDSSSVQVDRDPLGRHRASLHLMSVLGWGRRPAVSTDLQDCRHAR